MSMPEDFLVQYVRNENKVPIACMVGLRTYFEPEKPEIRIGVSICNKRDEFSKAVAFKTAYDRCIMNRNSIFNFEEGRPLFKRLRTTIKALPAFKKRCEKYFKDDATIVGYDEILVQRAMDQHFVESEI
jgi:hypothetical protein